MLIIKTVDELLGPYLQGEIGEVLDKVDVSLTFQDNKAVAATEPPTGTTEPQSSTITRPGVGARRQLEEPTTYLMEVSGSIDIVGGNMDDLLALTKERVTTIFKEFFEGVPRERLYEQLRNKGCLVDTIVIIDGDADSVENNDNPATTSPADDGSNNTALIAGLVAGGVALIALAAALILHRRKRR